MSELLRKIRRINKDVAREFERAGILTDSDIKSLSRDELRDLFPGTDKFLMRRSIYEIIHKPEPVDALFKELKGFVPCETLQAALKNNGVLVDYLKMLKDIKAQVDNVQGFLHAHIDHLEELKNPEPQEELDKAPLSGTSSSIQPDPMEFDDSQTGGQSLGAQDFSSETGSSGTSGTVGLNSGPYDCHSPKARDFLPGSGNLGANGPVGLNSGPYGRHSQEARDFSPGSGNLGANGTVGLNSGSYGRHSQEARDFSPGSGNLGANGTVGLNSGSYGRHSQEARDFSPGSGNLGANGTVGPNSGSYGRHSQEARVTDFSSETGSSGASGTVGLNSGPYGRHTPKGRGAGSSFSFSGQTVFPPQRAQVMYRSVVSGKTFDAHLQLMKKVEDQGQDRVRLVERSEDHKITVLFCPISSRVGSDVDAAMSDVQDDDKDIILVLMHHVREPKPTTNLRTWTDYKQVVLHVHVFYHETKNGLLTCQQNTDAISSIWSKLEKYKTPDTSGNALGMGADNWNTTNRGGNNSSNSGVFSKWFFRS